MVLIVATLNTEMIQENQYFIKMMVPQIIVLLIGIVKQFNF